MSNEHRNEQGGPGPSPCRTHPRQACERSASIDAAERRRQGHHRGHPGRGTDLLNEGVKDAFNYINPYI